MKLPPGDTMGIGEARLGVPGLKAPARRAFQEFSFENNPINHYGSVVTANEIIQEIKRLPKAEQNQVIEFARHAGENHPLTPEELGVLTKRMVDTKDPAEADRLQAEIVRGFYGDEPPA